MQFIVAYVSTGAVFLALDAVWLGFMSSRVYRPLIGDLLAEQPNWPPAVLFYLLYVAGVVVFAVQPALASGRWTTALALGAFLGLLAYGTYDLTNHATLRNWPAAMTAIDLAWGTFLTAAAATAGMLATRAFTH
ncbi:DUF2177 family protein [Ancylobacter dichloromethanicus]|uniref:Membrane protein n=1 Tax=Ancylobacter dichloromethanicus TaxID=518825 RepID=A0A9W6N0E8_9HYPH|nr:DUF2177 family protein [Ancylobacter dichloromethanicus]MBS7553150.1 DUF2177 family protein [Ancylobacter dichloromethanicus]GLK72927.1 membrane protein [Ancylobacter dichloromethanicus]